MTGCSRLRRIVKLRQLIRRWGNKCSAAASTSCIPSDVPSGHVAVNVGSNSRRFIVQATQLNHPLFKKLLAQAEEEYGFTNTTGPLAIPCDEYRFQEILCYLSQSGSTRSSRFINLVDFQKHCHMDSWLESRPFINRVSNQYLC